ncbi:universal stress protein [Desertifilum sp. FACHB-1129]|uniref:Universal stress protein n=1 Tax=Desertifilum tharense IPPAS B-1220 TaxID=1781255 RepID=A0A1E5QKX9_9CYAN|nr:MULTISPECIES: universal stress protein [Desertifilum]MDA0210454.1 universal stress protein [Cyanobacteria bacterium FC1]MDI9635255.1 universal stress protein [Geitlerinema splendidum]MBD2313909.1 universal stress protein [Desertifilum sp. FACHB-1129]MBD2324740.1 universal stress protein [Desertifilum sp. FACHB-866]MBD2334866.1 universal stress protein [Desertifilum sp. FACHB-868]
MFKTVLFPIDQSREAREAADVVADIVKKYSSRLILLSVLEEPEGEGETLQSDRMASPELVETLLKNAQTLFSEQGISAEIIERQGKAAFAICDVADEIDANLIVMGCRGIGLTEEGLQDSVTNRVINLSPCPVLIVP